MKKNLKKLVLHKKAISNLSFTIKGGFEKDTTEFTNISGCCTTNNESTRCCEV
ncbi:MAG: hypothetical protein AAF611_09220 [Bacteroidota bacterium]